MKHSETVLFYALLDIFFLLCNESTSKKACTEYVIMLDCNVLIGTTLNNLVVCSLIVPTKVQISINVASFVAAVLLFLFVLCFATYIFITKHD